VVVGEALVVVSPGAVVVGLGVPAVAVPADVVVPAGVAEPAVVVVDAEVLVGVAVVDDGVVVVVVHGVVVVGVDDVGVVVVVVEVDVVVLEPELLGGGAFDWPAAVRLGYTGVLQHDPASALGPFCGA